MALIEKEQPYPAAEVITLALHVDYWDRLGWKDPFSSPLFTQRQEFYARRMKLDSAYTPQMIVDGERQFVGSDLGAAAKAIAAAAENQKGKIELARDGERLVVKIAELPAHAAANVYLAIAENELVTNVARGENSGRRLEHQSVVRELRSLATLAAGENAKSLEAALAPDPAFRRENLRLVVFVQENESRRIVAAGRLAY